MHSSPTVTGVCLPTPSVPPYPGSPIAIPTFLPVRGPCSIKYISEPPTPSSTITIRGLSGSPNPDDNIIPTMSSVSRTSITRSTSRTYRWIEDQQHHLTAPVKDIPLGGAATVHDPYPTSPQTSTTSLGRGQNDDGGHVDGYEVPEAGVSAGNERVPAGLDATVSVTQVSWQGT